MLFVHAQSPVVSMHGGEAEAFKKGKWSEEEDEKLRAAVEEYGIQNWVAIEKFSGLGRPSKNCRLRWFNHLRPNLKKFPFTEEEERIILHLHHKYGNSWSLIASELPGRSDNEIKNYWNKRAKKCKKRQLPLYPPHTQEAQSPANSPKSKTQNNDSHKIKNQGKNSPEDNFIPTNYTNHTQSSISTHSPEPQPSTVLNVENTSSYPPVASTRTSIDSPQTLVSLTTYKIQFSTLSPCQISQPCPSPNMAKQTHVHALQQEGVGYKEFTPLRKPPILASVKGRFRGFSKDISQLSPRCHSVLASTSASINASELLPTDSSPQFHRSWPMESPRSPLKLKLSPRVTEQDSAEMSTINYQVSFPAVQLKSPTKVPHSPLKLRLLIPVTSNPTFQSELSRPDSTVQLYSSTRATSISSPQPKPSSSCGLDLPTTQPNAFDTYLAAPPDSSLTIKAELPSTQFYAPPIPETNSSISEVATNSNTEILDALKEARDRVQYLKKKLGQNKTPNKSFGKSKVKDCLSPSTSKEKHVLERTLRSEDQSRRNPKTGVLLNKSAKMDNISCKLKEKVHSRKRKYAHEEHTKTEELKQSENPEAKAFSGYSLKSEEHSLSESLNMRKFTSFPDHRHLIDLVDHLDNQNKTACPNTDSWDGKLCYVQDSAAKCLTECSITEGLFSESMEFLQEVHLMGGLLSPRSGIECPLDSQGPVSLAGAFGQNYRQYENTTTTLVKDNSNLNYLIPDEGGSCRHTFGQEFSDGMEREFTEQENLMDGNLAETSQFCESSLLLCQYPEANQLDSNCVVGKLLSVPGSLGCEQSYFQSSSGGLCKASLKMEDTSIETWKQEPSTDQSLEELLVETNWLKGSMVSQKQKLLTNVVNSTPNSSTLTHIMEFNHGNSESGYGNTGVLKQEEEYNHMDTMPEELSSLLEFFPTTIHTQVRYNNSNEFNKGEAYKLNMNFSLNQD